MTTAAATNSAVQNTLSKMLTDPVRNFKFVVTFEPTGDGVKTAATDFGKNFGKLGFVSMSGLTVSTESIAYREGGYNTNMHQLPGQSSFTPITFSKGVMLGLNDNSLWMKKLFSVLTPTATGGVGSNFRCNITIQVLSHPNPAAYKGSASATQDANTPYDQHTSLRFKVYNAWITSLSYSGLDAGSNTLMVEEMTVVHEGWDVRYAKDYTVEGTAPTDFTKNQTFS
jgi:phage tail-like protein